MRVALVYDRVNKWGGAERILLALHELFPDAPLFTSVYEPGGARWASIFSIKTSFLQNFPLARRSHEYFALLMPIAFEQFNFDRFNLVVSVTSEAAKAIITKPGTVHICYCLTPTRYLWSGYEEYFANPIFRSLSRPAVWYLRKLDKIASQRPDVFIAISKEVQRRIKIYYQRESHVVYPPLVIEKSNLHSQKKGTYFLIVSRLVRYKRIDLAIKACNELKLPLKIIGVGSEAKHLRAIAGPTVSFLGNLTDQELALYYKDCQALIFPGREDFGLAILEAQQFGKPVIAFKGGGALETVVDGKTGIFFSQQTVTALVAAIRRFKKVRFDPRVCAEHAANFSKERFQEHFLSILTRACSRL